VPPDVAAPPADAKKSPRGVFYKILKAVPGAPRPKASDLVVVHYSGWTTDGKPFDSSRTRGVPYTTSLGAVIAGWQDAIPLLGLGESARLWVPEELAYEGRRAPYGMLVFDIDLLEIKPQ
jgi:peptidylprolyl isomerase